MLYKNVYMTLGDIVALEDDTWYPNTSSDIVITTIMTTYSLVIEDSSNDKLTIFTQLMRYVYARFYDYDVYKTTIDVYDDIDDVSPTSAELLEIWRTFVNMFNITAPRYIPLLTQFNNNESAPLAQVSSTSSGLTRFNDTPQDEGDFSSDEHTTNITQTSVTTTSDPASIVERLDSLYKNWRSILKDWSSEFRCLFYVGGK